jgi:hypothetical protein
MKALSIICPKCGLHIGCHPEPIAPPFYFDYWTECWFCGEMIGESDLIVKEKYVYSNL